jgi:hypothetical protein
MKKFKILCGIAVIVIAVVAAFNVSIDNQKEILSSLALENVEALAGDDDSTGTLDDDSTGTLMEGTNSSGTKTIFCCCPGTNTCGSSKCPNSACETN